MRTLFTMWVCAMMVVSAFVMVVDVGGKDRVDEFLLLSTPPGPEPMASGDTLYMRGVANEVTVNNLTAYSLGLTQSATAQDTGVFGDGGTVFAGIRVWKCSSTGAVTEITINSVAICSVISNNEGLYSATWTPPLTVLAPTDSLAVRVYAEANDATPDVLRATFTTSQLGATQLDANQWTVWYYIRANSLGAGDDRFFWGTTVYNSKIEGVTYSSATSTATATDPIGGPSNLAAITLTYAWVGTPTSVNLYYTKNAAPPYTWVLVGNDFTVDGNYAYTITAGSGTYRWIASAVGGGSIEVSPPMVTTAPEASSYVFDDVRPTVLSTTPANAVNNVAVATNIVITFTETMNTGTFAYTITPNPGGLAILWSTVTFVNDRMTITHTAFSVNTRYWVNITTATDPAGNTLNPTPYSFYFNTVLLAPLVTHLPIRINSNADFNLAHGVTSGNGTVGNPWVIENYEISGAGEGYGIYVGNTTNYLVIQNCLVRYSSGVFTFPYYYDSGITMVNVINAELKNNQCLNSDRSGILIYLCQNVKIHSNICNNCERGIMIHTTTSAIISYNTVSDNTIDGIFLYVSDLNLVHNNSAWQNDRGIDLDDSSDSNQVINNLVQSNHWYGICILGPSYANFIENNNIFNNIVYGLMLFEGSSGNHIYYNNFVSNTNQAYEDGINTWDNGYPSGGNYWSDYIGVDFNSTAAQNVPPPDGLGDTPYANIGGGMGAMDNYPLMDLWSPPLLVNPTNLEITPDGDTMPAYTSKTFTISLFDEFGQLSNSTENIFINLTTNSPTGQFYTTPFNTSAKKDDVIISFVFDDSASMSDRFDSKGRTWLEAAKDAALTFMDELSDDSLCVSLWDFNGNSERRWFGPNDHPMTSDRYSTMIVEPAVRLGDSYPGGCDGRQYIRDQINLMENVPGQTILWDAIGGAYEDIAYYRNFYPGLTPTVIVLSDGPDTQASDQAPIALYKIDCGSAFWCPWENMSAGVQIYSQHKGKYTLDWANPATSTQWLRAMDHGGSIDFDRTGLLDANLKLFTIGLGLEHYDMPPISTTILTNWPGEVLDTSNALCTDTTISPPCKESGTLEYNLWRIANTSGAEFYYASDADQLDNVYMRLGKFISNTSLPVTQTTIPTGKSSVTFDYYDFTPGTWIINGNNLILGNDAINITILGSVHNINTDEYFNQIQPAIDDTDTMDGHTITVAAGTYNENVVVDKSLTLIGEDKDTTVIDGNNVGDVVIITADWVNVSGFTIQNSGIGLDNAGINLGNIENCIFNDNVCLNNTIGIYFTPMQKATTQITNNSIINDWGPQININSEMCWMNYDGFTNDIFYWDGSSIIQITATPPSDREPMINDRGEICWYGYDGSDFEIYLWNGSSITQITNNNQNDVDPLINANGEIVWIGNDGDDEIFLWDRTSIIQITNNSYDDVYPQINNNGQICWNSADGDDEIYYWDRTSIIQISNGTYYNGRSHLNDKGEICWHACETGLNFEIYYWNGSSTTRISSNPNVDYVPRINNNGEICWEGYDSVDGEIFYWDGVSITQITNNLIKDIQPDINEYGEICWTGGDNSDWDVYYWDGVTVIQISNQSLGGPSPQINRNGCICWTGENANGRSEIFYWGNTSNKENQIIDNVIINNDKGIQIESGVDNWIFHNSFIENSIQAIDNGSNNLWHSGYPSGGNYWSDWTSPDIMWGTGQNLSGSDGFVDNPRAITGGPNLDNYPFTTPNGWWNHSSPLLMLDKTAPATAEPGEIISYNITIMNIGASWTGQVNLIETYPSGVTFLSAFPSSFIGDNEWIFPMMGPGYTCTVQIWVQIDPLIVPGTVMVNNATLTYTFGIGPSYVVWAEASTLIISPEMMLTKSAPDKAFCGDIFTCWLNFSNTGTSTAHNVWVNDTLPSGMAFIASVPAATIIAPPFFGWFIGDIVPGVSGSIEVIVKVNPSVVGIITNSAYLDYSNSVGLPLPREYNITQTMIAFQLQLNPGWNLFSIPLIPLDTSLNSVLGDQLTGGITQAGADKVFKWDPVTGEWLVAYLYEDGIPGNAGWLFVTDTFTMEPDFAYWVWIRDDLNHTGVTLNMFGAIPGERNVPLSVGWNLVGYTSVTSMTLQNGAIDSSGLFASGFTGGTSQATSDRIFSWDGTGWQVQYMWTDGTWLGTTFDLAPGKGYWIEVREGHDAFVWTYGG